MSPCSIPKRNNNHKEVPMAGTAIVRHDSRLLLFQALGHTQFGGLFFDQVKKEGAGMSYEFAKKYYTVTSEPYLTRATYCVLGICNLGLVLASKNQLDIALSLIQNKKLFDLFQLGWEKISQLVKMKNYCDQKELGDQTWNIEKELAERFSAEPGKNWIGLDEYTKAKDEYEKNYFTALLRQHFRQHFIAKARDQYSYELGDSYVNNSLFTSLLFNDRMHAPLKPEEFADLYNWFKNPRVLKIMRLKLKDFSKTLTQKQRPFFWAEVEDSLNSAAFAKLALYAQQGDEERSLKIFYSQFYVEANPDKISQARYEKAKAEYKSPLKNFEDLQLELDRLKENMPDISDKLAIIDVVLEPRFVPLLTADDLTNIMAADKMLWQTKICWPLVNDRVFHILLKDKSTQKYTGLMLEDFLGNLQTFTNKHIKKLIAKLQMMSNTQLYNLCKESADMRDFLLKHIRREPNIYADSISAADTNILFIPPNEWPHLWQVFSLESAEFMFKELRRYYRELNIPADQAEQMFFERVKIVCRFYQRDKKNPKKDYPTCEAPYYNADLKKAVAHTLSPKKFKAFSQKLADLA
ncbi:MAG: hypothetical protein NTZ49_03680 [Candidatus Parcubacteria bacterium]|nr:hypothetical protein [Candidatus Parcubacteria bacterium]